ncbi:DUF6436 domain-containing protein [Colwellia sp. 1_MG-2023]|uniref:DUF6436 domain-containing protein n=1 Tax=Colwellia sp. 1_MG-2023 TaxID=3062649 RepID=UPI0026E20BBB|nr:DUF6436 domain-containing protein [Colwellia sp. 1_MG-2023]MDO6447024.1 DUF6436 domain-containing protein [Colwellia sp. 1_MG-2023]
MSKALDKVWLLFFMWLIAGSTGLYYLKYGKLQLFDPDATLAINSSQIKFDRKVEDYFKKNFAVTNNAVFHIQSSKCGCNTVTSRHIIELNELFLKNESVIQYLSVEDFPDINKLIPSSPSIVIFNSRGELTYLGPYSAGAFCSTSNSFVTRFAKKSIEGAFMGAYVIHDAYGCYCLNH